jgi:hypothetical protein
MKTVNRPISLSFLVLLWSCAGTKPIAIGGSGGSAEHVTAGGGAGENGGGGQGGGVAGTTGSGAGGGGAAESADARNCGLYQFQPTPKAADILMVLDRSGSMTDVPEGAPAGSTTTKWQIVVPSLEQVVTATQSSISWGLKSFPEAYTDSLSNCAGGITSAIDVQVTPTDGTTMNNAIAALTPNGSGTPTADAITAAVTTLKTVNDTNPKYLLLATDGEPDCVGTSKDDTNAGPAAVTAIGSALTAGFPTFVVGIATTKASDNTELNAMAVAGGEGIPSTNPLASHYYLANNATTLVAALQAITGQISSCLFPLATPPPVPNNPNKLGVYLGSALTKIPYDASKADGWAYTDTNDTAVEVYGAWCDMIQVAGAGAVQIKYGCMTIDVP